MQNVTPEYPKGQHKIEMVLVNMMKERRSWADYNDIADALLNVRRKAKTMAEEREMIFANVCQNTCEEPNAKET